MTTDIPPAPPPPFRTERLILRGFTEADFEAVHDYASDPEHARREINDWVAEHTREHITDLLPEGSINNGTRLVLTNAIYFSAAWEEPFPVSGTADRPFYLGNEQSVSVPTLHHVTSRGMFCR